MPQPLTGMVRGFSRLFHSSGTTSWRARKLERMGPIALQVSNELATRTLQVTSVCGVLNRLPAERFLGRATMLVACGGEGPPE
jgi:hypothetical protein